jgi:putative Mg2+ transporter-C (MgtC) family protein
MVLEMNELITRLAVAVVLSVVIGVEREYHKRPAGILTLPLVALGSALMTVLSFSVPGVGDPTRIAAGIATGIGFIGAGAILKVRDSVRGVTTAAVIWVVAAIGMASGFGFYREATVTAALGLAIVILGYPLKDYLESRRP